MEIQVENCLAHADLTRLVFVLRSEGLNRTTLIRMDQLVAEVKSLVKLSDVHTDVNCSELFVMLTFVLGFVSVPFRQSFAGVKVFWHSVK